MAIYDGVAAIGVFACGVRVLPHLWDTSIIDCLIVGGCLTLFFAMLLHKSLTGEWPS